ncbi:MAG: hypothetical protein JKY65_21920 [Planctomycetes bacterium]|nr:hypothetical protein [Planctomycetota bacterium]
MAVISSATQGAVDPSTTITVVAGGFSPSGAASSASYGVDDVSPIIDGVAARLSAPTSTTSPAAPNQVTEVTYYGSQPPAYYSAEDLRAVDAAERGAPRYALIVAKHIREVIRRSGARHVNLVGASFGGVITRTIIEHDLEGLVSGGWIVRWLTLEGTAGGVWIATQIANNPTLAALATAIAPDPSDVVTMSYDHIRTRFNTPDAGRSTSPNFANIVVGFQVSTNHDFNQQVLRVASGSPNDGVLLVKDQAIVLDARPRGPAIVLTDSTHDSARTHEGLAADVANFIRSTRRVRIKLVEATVVDPGENPLLGTGEVSFSATLHSPEALREWGTTDPLATLSRRFGTASWAEFDPGQTRSFDAPLFDWFVAPGEQTLALTLDAEQIDFNTYYNVIENPLDDAQGVETLRFDLPVAVVGTQRHTIRGANVSVIVEVEVFDELPGQPQ